MWKPFILTTSIPAIHLWYCHYFTGALEAIHYVKCTVFISQQLLQASIIVSYLWLIRENLKATVFILENQL